MGFWRILRKRRPRVEELEPRILYSASAGGMAVDAAAETWQQRTLAEMGVDDDGATAPSANTATSGTQDAERAAADRLIESLQQPAEGQAQQPRREITFIDGSVAGLDELIASLPAGTEYHVLAKDEDGLAQIERILQGREGLDAIHVLSEGGTGQFQLGNRWVTEATLADSAAMWQRIGQSLSETGDILLYGCRVGSGEFGGALVDELARLTQADVAASTDTTGGAAQGGNWTLEQQAGHIETATVLDAQSAAAYDHVMATYTVTNANDSGAGTLRQAILDANANSGLDTIVFSIGTGARTITLSSGLPTITGPVVIDATTQPGYAGTPLIEINGTGAAGAPAFTISSSTSGTVIRGFVLNRFSGGTAIRVQNATGVTIAGNWIGTNAAGTAASANLTGVVVTSSSNVTIGGTTAADRNVISGNNSYAINLTNGATGVTISGNYIGTNATNSGAMGNLGNAIHIDGTAADSTVGGTAAGAGNVIANNGGPGVYLSTTGASPTGISILGNSMYSNTGAADISFAGWSPANDAGDADTGLNNQQNKPVLSAGRVGGSNSSVTWSLNSNASRNYRIEFFAGTSSAEASALYLGYVDVTTDASGNVSSTTTSTLAGAPSNYVYFTATATDLSTGDTSQFSSTVQSTTPYVVTSGGNTAFTEGGGAVVIDSALTVSDPNSTTLPSATVSITGNFVTGEDVLAFTNNPATMGNIAGSYNATTGVLSLTSAGGTATIAQWQAALRSVTYSNSSGSPDTGDRTIAFVASDGTGPGGAGTKTVTVTAVNAAPTVSTSGGTTAYTENGSAVAVDSGLTVSDTDNATLASATVSITGNFASGQDVLAFTNNPATMGNITGSYSAGTGVYTLTSSGATATVAQWQAALRSVTYANSSDTPNTSNRTIAFVVNDGSTNSSAANKTVSVTAANDAPVVSTSGGTTGYTENGVALAIDGSLTVSDPDTTTLASATVSITGNFASGQDVLAFTNNPATMGNIAGSYDAATGVYTLTSAGATATLAQWQAALRAVTYANSSDNPSTSNRTVSYVVNDGSTNSSAATKTVSVTASNDAPVASTSGGTTAFTENGAAVTIDSGLTVSDADNTTLASATVSITGNFASGQDVLAFTNNPATMGNITGSYSAGTGVYTLTSSGATATVAQWQAALRSVTYANSSDTPNTSNRTIAFVVNDGSTNSSAANKTVSVTAANDAPVVSTSGGTTAYTENGVALAIDGALTLSDPDNATLASATVSITGNFAAGQDVLAFTSNPATMGNIAGSWDAATGVYTLTSSGATATLAQWQAALRAVTYANSSDNPSTGNRTISYVVNDGSTDSAAATKTVSVAAVNDAPVVSTSGGTTAYTENGAATVIDGSLTVTDADNTTLASATVSITGNFASGQDALAFTNNPATMGNIAGSYDPATGVYTLTSAGATATLAQWQAALRAVTYANSSDNPSTANRTISVVVNDGSTDSSAATKTVIVAASNDAPVVSTSGGTTAYTENGAATAIDGSLTITDADNTTLASATVSITGNFASGQDMLAFANNPATMGNIAGSYDAATGVYTLTSAGATATLAQWQAALRAVTYANSADNPSTSNRTVSYVVNDGSTDSSAATKTVSVAAVNDAPVVSTSGGTTAYTENGAATAIDGSLTVTDADNTTLASATVSITGNFASGQDVLALTHNPATMGNIAGSYDAATGVYTLTSAGATATLAQWQAALRAVTYANSSDNPSTANRTISVVVNDGSTDSSAATKTVSVAAVNDAPVVSTSGGTTAYTENGAATAIDGSLTVTDADNTTFASATVSITGNFASGQDVLAFTNNPATMGNIAGSYDAATGVYTLTSAGATATLAQWQAALRAVTYANSSDNPSTANRTISVVVNDGSTDSAAATKTVSVAAVNDAPVASTSGGTTAYTENGAATAIDGSLTVADADNTTLASATVSITGNFASGEDVLAFTHNPATMGNIAGSYDAATGIYTLSSAGATATLAEWQAALRAVTYANSSDTPSTGNRTITFVVNDGSTDSAGSTKTLSVAAVNDAPVVSTSGGTTAYTENGAAVAVDGGVSVTDLDTATLASATVSITGNFAGTEDVLAFANDGSTMGNIAASYDAATGVLSLTSAGATATLAEWQAALRAVTYANTSDDPSTANRTISVVVNDGSTSSAAATKAVSVAAVNDAPAVATSGGTTAYTENGAATAIDASLTVSDADDATLASATVSITGNFASGQDVLAFSNNPATMGNIAGSYDAATGIYTLASAGATATLAEWQAALRAVTYANTSDNPSTANRTVSFVVNDGSTDSAAATKTVSMTAVNDAPVVSTSGATTAYTEGGAAVAVDGSLTVTDADHTTLASATVSISGNFASGEDVLAFANNPATMGNIAGSYDAATGVYTLSSAGATATLAQWQAALRAVTYANTSGNPSTASRTVSVVVNDGSTDSVAATKAVSVAAANDAPVVSTSGGTTAYTENGAATTIDGALTVTDTDSATLASATVSITGNFASGQDVLAFANNPATMGNIAGSYDAATGIYTLTSAGATATLAEWQAALRSVTYANTSDDPSTASRTVSIVVNDGNSDSAAATKTVSVAAVNDAPAVATSGGTTAYTENGAATAIDGSLTVTDADTTTLASATVSITGNFASGEDVLAFTNNPATMGNIAGSYDSATGVYTLTSAGATATLAQWQAALRAVTYANTSETPSTANRTVSFVVNDGSAGSATSTKTLSVAAVNDAPVVSASGGTTAYTENGAATVIDSSLTVSDADTATLASATVAITGNFASGQDVLAFANNPATMGNIAGSYDAATGIYTLTSAGATATLAQWQAALRSVTYANTSDNPSTANRTISYVVNDGSTDSAATTESVSVAAVNDAPVVTTSGGTTAYTENGAALAVDSGLAVSDADHAALASATVSITGNFAGAQDVLAFANDGSTMGNIAASYDAATGVLTMGSAGATASLAQWQAALRAVTYANTSDNPSTANRTISVVVDDGSTDSATATKTLSVAAVNDAPVVAPSGGTTAYTENGAATAIDGSLTVTDADHATLATATVSITGNFASGQDVLAFTSNPATMGNIAGSYDAATGVYTLSSAGATATLAQWQAALRAVTYTNSSDNPSTANRTISYVVNDGSTDSSAGTKTISVSAVNDAPVVSTSGGTTAYTENGAATAVDGGISVADADSATLASATVAITGNFAGAQDVLAFANDGSTMGNITGSYDAATGVYTLGSAGGTATLAEWQAALRAVTYANASDDPSTANRTVTYVVNDGSTDSLAGTKTLSVGAVNDAPVAATSGGTTAYTENGTAVAIDGSLTVSDADHTTLASATVAITGNFASGQDVLAFANNPATMGNIAGSYDAATGVYTLSSAGATATLAQWQAALRAVTYANSSDDPSTANRTISFVVNDGTADSAAGTKTVSVAAVNDVPVVSTSGGTTAYTENGAATVVDGGITVADADHTTLASATVSITGSFASGQDVLAFANNPATMGNIAGSYDAGTGVYTLTSAGATATLAQWQAALRAVTYANSSDDPSTSNRTVSIVVNDGSTDSVAATKTLSVAAVNDAPVVSTSGGTTAYTENGAATAVDAALTVSDADTTTFASATVSITGNFASGEDVLAFAHNPATMGNIAGSYDAATGVYTLNSAGATATLAQWQAALRAVTYTNTSDHPSTASRTLSFVVNDGSTDSAAATKTVSVAAVNDAPVVSTSGGTTAYTENGAANAIDGSLTVTDADNTTLASATVSITGNFASGEDVLAFANNPATMGNITGSYDAATGVYSLGSAGATATLAQWQAALRAVTYANTSDDPSTASRTVSYVLNDGNTDSVASTKTVTVAAVNDAPVVSTSGGTTAYTENGAATAIDTALTVADADHSTLASATVSITGNFAGAQDVLAFTNDGSTMGNIAASYDAATGVLTLGSAGATATLAEWQAALRAVTYANTSDSPNTANRTISVVVHDGGTNSTAGTKTVSVAAVNDEPVVSTSGGTTAYTENGVATAIDASLTVADADHTTLASATVSITGNFASGQDVLAFTNNPATMGNIAGSYDAATGVYTLSSVGATATLAQWQAALRAVTYANTSDDPNTANRTISVVVNDGSTDSTAATKTLSVAAVNDAPVVSTSGGTTAYTENGAATAIDGALTVADADNTTLASATVSITGNFAAGQDVLAFANNPATMGNIAGSYDAATGIYTLTSAGATATLAQWQAALRAVTYANTSDDPSTANRTVSVVVNDGSTGSVAATKTVSVAAVNDAPVVTTTGGTTAYTENGAAIAVDGGLTVGDADTTTLASATVSITGNFASGQDVLAFANNPATMGNISGSYDAATGVYTLTSAGATATLAEWQAALRAVTYANSGDNPSTASRTIGFAVNDGSTGSAASTKTLSVAAVNDAPVVATSGGTVIFVENGSPVAVDASLTVSDADNATLASATVAITGNFQSSEDVLAFANDGSTMGNITASYDAATGLLTLGSAGATATVAEWQAALRAVTYGNGSATPSTLTRTLAFTVNDGAANSNTATRSVGISTHAQPVVSASGGTTAYTENGAALAVDGGLTVSDADTPTLASATVAITGNFAGAQDVLAFANDGSTMGNIAASYDSATGVLSLSSAGATATLAQWQAALRAVTYANTSDDPSTSNRTVSVVVNDGTADSLASTKTLSVAAVNDAPVVTASGGTTAFTENGAAVAVDGGLTVSDVDDTTLASATVAITGNFAGAQDVLAFVNDGSTMGNITGSYNAGTGVYTLSSAGATATLAQWQAALRAVTYANGSDHPSTANRTVSVVVNDGSADSLAATKTVSVTAVNDAPVVSTSGGTTAYTENGAAAVVDGSLTVTDTDNATLASATVSITGNFASGQDVLAFTNNPATMGNIGGSYDAATGVYALTSAGATATLAQWQAALRAVTYANGSDNPSTANRTISFLVNDGSTDSAAATKTVSVAAVNDAPVVSTSGSTTAYTENGAALAIDGSLTLTDADNTTLASATVSVTGNFASGQDVIAFTNNPGTMGNIAGSYDAATGVYTLSSAGATATLAQWHAALRAVTYANSSDTPSTASRTIGIVVNDGSTDSVAASKTVSVAALNDAPIVSTSGGTTAYTENGAATVIDGSLTVTDADNTTIASGTVSITGNFASGQDVLAFTNNPATMGNIAGGYDAATGVYTLSSAGATATLAQWQAALRAVTYANTSDDPSTVSRTLSFVIHDGSTNSAAATKTLGITAVNDAPAVSASGGSTAFTENGAPVAVDAGLVLADVDNATVTSARIALTGNFAGAQDVLAFVNDGSSMGNIAASYDAATGVLTMGSAGATATLAQWQAALRAVTYANGSDAPSTAGRTIGIVINDGAADSAPATKTVSVAAVNDAPAVSTSGGTGTATENGPAIAVDPGLTLTDVDSATLDSAVISIAGNFAPGQDTLAFTNDGSTMGNIAASYDAATGVLTMSSAGATATLAEWQAALRAVTYANGSDDPSTAPRTVTFVVNDGTASSVAAGKALAVVAVNDAPVVATTGGTAAYTEGSAPVPVDAGLTLADLDHATLASATVSVTGNFAAGQDQLAFANDGSTMGNIAASYDAATGVLTMGSAGATATLAQWQAALRAVTYANSTDMPATAVRTIGFAVHDGVNASAVAGKALSVTAVNDAPVVTTSGGANGYANGATVVDAGLVVADTDTATLASATVSIVANFSAGQDVLGFVNDGGTMGNIAASYDAATGVLTMSSAGATATVAEWQAALRAVTYANGSGPGAGLADRQFSFAVDDGAAPSANASKWMRMAAPTAPGFDLPPFAPSPIADAAPPAPGTSDGATPSSHGAAPTTGGPSVWRPPVTVESDDDVFSLPSGPRRAASSFGGLLPAAPRSMPHGGWSDTYRSESFDFSQLLPQDPGARADNPVLEMLRVVARTRGTADPDLAEGSGDDAEQALARRLWKTAGVGAFLGVSWWYLRLAGLASAVAASRRVWATLDPMPLLAQAHAPDDPAATQPPDDPPTDGDEVDDELAADRLLEQADVRGPMS